MLNRNSQRRLILLISSTTYHKYTHINVRYELLTPINQATSYTIDCEIKLVFFNISPLFLQSYYVYIYTDLIIKTSMTKIVKRNYFETNCYFF